MSISKGKVGKGDTSVKIVNEKERSKSPLARQYTFSLTGAKALLLNRWRDTK
jgi:hypothetical protein